MDVATAVSNDVKALVDTESGELDRRIFSDPEIFELEMKTIFARAWLFLCHETQIPKRGDFYEAPMGRDNVLVVRQRDGGIKGLVNTCSHRGNAVCRAEEGNVKNFSCTYHGWTFDLAGELVGVPGLREFYNDELDKSKHPLRRARVQSYKGFVFGTFDETAPDLEDFLGKTGRLGLDLIAERGDMEVVPGVQKFVVKANWKLTVDNLFDWYHPQITHMSAVAAGFLPAPEAESLDKGGAMTTDGASLGVQWRPYDLDNIVVLGEYGHAISGPTLDSMAEVTRANPGWQSWRESPGAQEALGPVGAKIVGHPGIFPTAWVTNGAQLSLRVPRSPDVTEIWWFSFRDRNQDPEMQKVMRTIQMTAFGPAGLLEQDDGENWAQSTMTTFGEKSRSIPQLLKMGLGRGKIVWEDEFATVEAPTNEHGQLWTYKAWQEWLANPTWDELRARTTPGEFV